MKTLILPLLCLMCMNGIANNVQISNVSVTNNPTNTGKIIQFDVSWENSWRTTATNNWDGVWVFFKFKDNNGSWYPLQFTGTNITAPVGVAYEMGNNAANVGIGMFIYRAQNGFGTATVTAFKAGIQSFPGLYEVRGFALEMVYIPGGSFFVGDAVANNSYKNGVAGTTGFQITANGAGVTMGNTAGMLYDAYGPYSGNLTGFPTGFSAYWMMKYELPAGAFRDFLNTLTYAQQITRFTPECPPTNAAGSFIYGNTSPLKIATAGNATGSVPAIVGCDFDNDNIVDEPTDGEWLACTNLTWADVAAYLDWAGLRPPTELEFEKAARGPSAIIPEEFAWGTNTIADYAYVYTNKGTATEAVSNYSSVAGNALYQNTLSNTATLRNGIFATAFSTRISAGAGFYGAMELSGNVGELCVTTSNVAGRSYTGKHGDGKLTAAGNADENYWPGVNGATGINVSAGEYISGLGVISDGGICMRGGTRTTSRDQLKTAARLVFMTGTQTTLSRSAFGIRGVRDAN